MHWTQVLATDHITRVDFSWCEGKGYFTRRTTQLAQHERNMLVDIQVA